MTPGPDQQVGDPIPLVLDSAHATGLTLTASEGSSYLYTTTGDYVTVGSSPFRLVGSTEVATIGGGISFGLPTSPDFVFVGFMLVDNAVGLSQVISDIGSNVVPVDYNLAYLAGGKFGSTNFITYNTIAGGVVNANTINPPTLDITNILVNIDIAGDKISSPSFSDIPFAFNGKSYKLYFIVIDQPTNTGVQAEFNTSASFPEVNGLLGGAQIIPGTVGLPTNVQDNVWYKIINPNTYGDFVAEEGNYVMFFNNQTQLLPIRSVTKKYVDDSINSLGTYVDSAVANVGLTPINLFQLKRRIGGYCLNEHVTTIEGNGTNVTASNYESGFAILILDMSLSFDVNGGYTVGDILISTGTAWVKYQPDEGEVFTQSFLHTMDIIILKTSTPVVVALDNGDFELALNAASYGAVEIENGAVLGTSILTAPWQYTVNTSIAETTITVGQGIGDPGRTELTFSNYNYDLNNGTGLVRIQVPDGVPALYYILIQNGTPLDNNSRYIYVEPGVDIVIRFYVLYGDVFYKIEGATVEKSISISYDANAQSKYVPNNLVEFITIDSNTPGLDNCALNVYYNFNPGQIITFLFGQTFTNFHLQLDSAYNQLRLSPFATTTPGDSVTYRVRQNGTFILIASTIT